MTILDVLFYIPFVIGFLSFNFGKSGGEQKSETGLRGTQYFGPAAEQAASSLEGTKALVDSIATQPFGMFQGSTGPQMFNPGQFGLGVAADEGVRQALNYSLNRMSAGNARRGQLAPENIPGVAASATQNVLPTLLPQISDMAKWIYMLPELWKQSLFGYRTGLANLYAPYLGSQSSGSQSGMGFGFGLSGAPSGSGVIPGNIFPAAPVA